MQQELKEDDDVMPSRIKAMNVLMKRKLMLDNENNDKEQTLTDKNAIPENELQSIDKQINSMLIWNAIFFSFFLFVFFMF